MFDIGIGEVFIILVVALLVFGPDRLPTMAKQAASFVRDLRAMVANARRDLSSTVGDLGIDQEDIKSLTDLRNPKSFVRKKVLDGLDLGLDDDGSEQSAPETKPSRSGAGADSHDSAKNGVAATAADSGPAITNGATTNGTTPAADPAITNGATPTADEPALPAQRFDPDAT